MKIRISRRTLADLPNAVAAQVEAWGMRYHKAHFHLTIADHFTTEEDARYAAFSADLSKSVHTQAAGEFAGHSGLRPCARCEIPAGCTVIETQFFCGLPVLTIFHNPAAGQATIAGVTNSALVAA